MQLPIEILTHIATQTNGYVYREMLAVPEFARFTLNPANTNYLQNRMIEKNTTDLYIEYRLLGKLHSYDSAFGIHDDQPAVMFIDGTRLWFRYGKYQDGAYSFDDLSYQNNTNLWSRHCIDYTDGKDDIEYITIYHETDLRGHRITIPHLLRRNYKGPGTIYFK